MNEEILSRHATCPAWIGLDIGGANLKASNGRDRTESIPFPLWQRPGELAGTLTQLIAHFIEEPTVGIAMTMTGELADCYPTKSEGVRAIVNATIEAAGGLPVSVATTDDRWLTPKDALTEPLAVAAANWRVAARLVARHRPTGNGLWIDVGSTTTDLIPIHQGIVTPTGWTDPERLQHGELVYTGVRRTPICAVVDRLPYAGRDCPVAAEWFATTADAWVLLGELAEDEADCSTANSRPLTKEHARDRLARSVCADRDSYSKEDALLAAEQIATVQTKKIASAMSGRTVDWLILCGEGEFLGRRAAKACWKEIEPESISCYVGSTASQCLPAYAAAVLAAREIGTRQ